MSDKKYTLTEEHRAQLKPWADKWIKNTLSTEPIDEPTIKDVIKNLYKVSDLAEPIVVTVPSPFVGRMVAGAAAAYYHALENKEPFVFKSIPYSDHPTVLATKKGIEEATGQKISFNTEKMPAVDFSDKWFNSGLAKYVVLSSGGDFALDCAKQSGSMSNYGNQNSGHVAFISFFRHIVKLPLDYTKWHWYEEATIHGGPRWLHEKFCVVSDRPKSLYIDARNRPHNDTGPFCEWRDGTKLFQVHGVRIPSYIIENPERLTAKLINEERNAEVRRVMLDKIGLDKYWEESNAHCVKKDKVGELYKIDLPGDEPLAFVRVKNSTQEPDGTYKHYIIRVPPNSKTPKEAVAWTFNVGAKDYRPQYET